MVILGVEHLRFVTCDETRLSGPPASHSRPAETTLQKVIGVLTKDLKGAGGALRSSTSATCCDRSCERNEPTKACGVITLSLSRRR